MSGNGQTLRQLGIATAIALAVLLLEMIGGIFSHSLALLSDAGHILADVFALGMSWFALRLAKRPANANATFGYHRVGILVALINGVSLIAIAALIVREAYTRVIFPVEVNTVQLLIVASLGLTANLGMVGLLHKGHRESLTMRSAWLHVMGDSLASVGVICAGLVIMTTGWRYVDSVVSAMIALFIFLGGLRVVRDATRVLLELPPRFLRASDLEAAILAVEGVKGVHDLHLWSITPQFPYVSTHLVVEEQPLSRVDTIVKAVENKIKQLGVVHTTVQVECNGCGVKDTFCAQNHTTAEQDKESTWKTTRQRRTPPFS